MHTYVRSMIRLAITTSSLLALQGAAFAGSSQAGAVFIQTNAPEENAITVFTRASDGSLTLAGQVATGGLGTGGGLGDQGALALSHDHRFLLTVNAGSNDLSVFAVNHGTIELVDLEPSGGERPVSVTVRGETALASVVPPNASATTSTSLPRNANPNGVIPAEA